MTDIDDGTGNCFVVALQMVYDQSTTDDILPTIIAKHGHNTKDFDYDTLRLVHGSAMINDQRRNHAWVEIGDYAIDYSNRCEVMSLKEIYYDPKKNDHRLSIALRREQVLLLMQYPHASFYWGGYTKDDLDRMQKAYTSSISLEQTWKSRNFLTEFEAGRNQLQK